MIGAERTQHFFIAAQRSGTQFPQTSSVLLRVAVWGVAVVVQFHWNFAVGKGKCLGVLPQAQPVQHSRRSSLLTADPQGQRPQGQKPQVVFCSRGSPPAFCGSVIICDFVAPFLLWLFALWTTEDPLRGAARFRSVHEDESELMRSPDSYVKATVVRSFELQIPKCMNLLIS